MYGGQALHADGRELNLNEPGVVRTLLDEALSRGWRADESGRSEIDGWSLFDAVTARARFRKLGCRPSAEVDQTPAPRPIERKVLHLRRSKRLGPARIGWRLGLPASTCHAILRRAGQPRLAYLDRATAEPIRRYEHDQPGDLIHVDVKKLGNIPDGGGWRTQGRAQGKHNRSTTPDL